MNPDARRRAGERVVALPPSALSMLRSRFVSGERLDQPLFPDVLGGFRDPANVRREFREARGEAALAWITSYSFRKTTATILDEAALSARLVANQLGHARPSMTQDVYIGRRAADSEAAQALEVALEGDRGVPELGPASQPRRGEPCSEPCGEPQGGASPHGMPLPE